MKPIVHSDGVLVSKTFREGDNLVQHTDQPNRLEVLRETQKLRARGVKSKEWAGAALNIPELDYWMLVRANPDLRSPDAQIQTQAWKKFLNSAASDPYRVNDRNKARRR